MNQYVSMKITMPRDLYEALGRIATAVNQRTDKPPIGVELIACSMIRVGLGASTAEAIDKPEVLDLLGKRLVEHFIRGDFS